LPSLLSCKTRVFLGKPNEQKVENSRFSFATMRESVNIGARVPFYIEYRLLLAPLPVVGRLHRRINARARARRAAKNSLALANGSIKRGTAIV